MMNRALRVVLALSVAAPAGAAVGAGSGQGQQALQRVADVANTATGSASLEHGNQGLSRAYDLAANTPAASPTDSTQPIPPQLQPPPPQQGAHFTPIPQPTPDVDNDSKKKDDADAKKKDLQRMAIGGAGGALVLAIFGFIFGGPIGAAVMGAIGFAAFAGITHLNNNPI